MWVKLGNEHLNLNHVVRVRFNKGWKNGQEELVAEVEGLIKGEVQVFARYRGREAEVLHAVFQHQPAHEAACVAAAAPAPASILPELVAAGAVAGDATSQAATPTMHDM